MACEKCGKETCICDENVFARDDITDDVFGIEPEPEEKPDDTGDTTNKDDKIEGDKKPDENISDEGQKSEDGKEDDPVDADKDQDKDKDPGTISAVTDTDVFDMKNWLKEQPEHIRKSFNDLNAQVGLYKGRAAMKLDDVLKQAGIDPASVNRNTDTKSTTDKTPDLYEVLDIGKELREDVDKYLSDDAFSKAMQMEAVKIMMPLFDQLRTMQNGLSDLSNVSVSNEKREKEEVILKAHVDAADLLTHDMVMFNDVSTVQFKNEDFQRYYDSITDIDRSRFLSDDARDTVKLLNEYKASRLISTKKQEPVNPEKPNKKTKDSFGTGAHNTGGGGSSETTIEKSETDLVDDIMKSRAAR